MGEVRTYQQRVDDWMQQCFGPAISADTTERNHRFLEEALELVQSLGCTASEAHQLVDYTFGRPIGEPAQEVGGVSVTLAALCNAAGLDAPYCGEEELARVWTKVEQIRAKQAAKPKHSPLPEPQPPAADDLVEGPRAKCSCAEVYGEDPRCFKHGRGTEWFKSNPDICWAVEKAAAFDSIADYLGQERASCLICGEPCGDCSHFTNDQAKHVAARIAALEARVKVLEEAVRDAANGLEAANTLILALSGKRSIMVETFQERLAARAALGER